MSIETTHSTIWYIKAFSILFMVFIACNKDENIIRMIESDNHDKKIQGAYKAGETRDKRFVPYLLHDAYDFTTTTHISYKGISVYQAKMQALEDIYQLSPPVKITSKPNSAVIIFYSNLHEKDIK